jgi:uncharacterized membrane protein
VSDGFKNIVDLGTTMFELSGVVIIVGGFLLAAWRAVRIAIGRNDGRLGYEEMKSVFGRTVLLGLEVLVAADIIRTVAVDPTLNNMLVLGMLVLIRTFLSWSLEIELEGMPPWRRWQLTEGPRARRAGTVTAESGAAATGGPDDEAI